MNGGAIQLIQQRLNNIDAYCQEDPGQAGYDAERHLDDIQKGQSVHDGAGDAGAEDTHRDVATHVPAHACTTLNRTELKGTEMQ